MFELAADRSLPLTAHRNRQGSEVLQAIHPRQRGRVLLVHGAGGDSYQWLQTL